MKLTGLDKTMNMLEMLDKLDDEVNDGLNKPENHGPSHLHIFSNKIYHAQEALKELAKEQIREG